MKIQVTQAVLPEIEEYIKEIQDVWQNHWLTNMGIKHELFKKQLLEFLDVPYIELLVNGHMALEMSLQALDLEGEVITTPFTFASTTHAIVRNNLTPVFCDIKENDFSIDENKIEELITDKTCAIMPVHVYGNICNIEKIQELADAYKLKVIYDAAHAFGEKYKGISVGNFGDVSCFSFHATKVFNSIEGGASCFHNVELQKKIYNLKNFGIRNEECVESIGANAKMNEFQAAMGLCNLRHLKENIMKRRIIVERYQEKLDGILGIRTWKKQSDVESNYGYFPIVVDEEKYGMSRDSLYQLLRNYDIYTRKYFYPITNSFSCYANRFSTDDTPVALKLSKQVLTLPLYPDLQTDIVDKICEIIQDK